MVIYMDEYRTAKTEPAAWLINSTYGDEIMYAMCNPAIVQMIRETSQIASGPDLPDDNSTIHANEFLDRVYGLATLI